MKQAREDTRDCGPRCLTLAGSYDGRADITDAVRALLDDEILQGHSLRDAAEHVSVDSIAEHFSSSDRPVPDPLIGTSGGHCRIHRPDKTAGRHTSTGSGAAARDCQLLVARKPMGPSFA